MIDKLKRFKQELKADKNHSGHSVVGDAIAALEDRRTITQLIGVLSEHRAYLDNLLSVIHHDGGHYIKKHGYKKAVDDAIKNISNKYIDNK